MNPRKLEDMFSMFNDGEEKALDVAVKSLSAKDQKILGDIYINSSSYPYSFFQLFGEWNKLNDEHEKNRKAEILFQLAKYVKGKAHSNNPNPEGMAALSNSGLQTVYGILIGAAFSLCAGGALKAAIATEIGEELCRDKPANIINAKSLWKQLEPALPQLWSVSTFKYKNSELYELLKKNKSDGDERVQNRANNILNTVHEKIVADLLNIKTRPNFEGASQLEALHALAEVKLTNENMDKLLKRALKLAESSNEKDQALSSSMMAGLSFQNPIAIVMGEISDLYRDVTSTSAREIFLQVHDPDYDARRTNNANNLIKSLIALDDPHHAFHQSWMQNKRDIIKVCNDTMRGESINSFSTPGIKKIIVNQIIRNGNANQVLQMKNSVLLDWIKTPSTFLSAHFTRFHNSPSGDSPEFKALEKAAKQEQLKSEVKAPAKATSDPHTQVQMPSPNESNAKSPRSKM